MATKFNLIQEIHTKQKQILSEVTAILEGFTSIGVLVENVTHVLANIAAKADAGDTIEAASQDSIAAFLAGVEAISQRLGKSAATDRSKSLVRVLNQCEINPDGTINTACVPVAEIGASFPDIRKKYYRMLALYNMSLSRGRGAANKELIRSVRALQHQIDTAMRQSAALQPKPKAMAAARPAMGGTAPASI